MGKTPIEINNKCDRKIFQTFLESFSIAGSNMMRQRQTQSETDKTGTQTDRQDRETRQADKTGRQDRHTDRQTRQADKNGQTKQADKTGRQKEGNVLRPHYHSWEIL